MFIREFFENPASRIFAKRPKQHRRESRVSLLIDVQQKLQTKGPGYARWAKIHNLKEMSKSLLFLREHGFETMKQLDAFIAEKTENGMRFSPLFALPRRKSLRSQRFGNTSSITPTQERLMKHTVRPVTA